MANNPIEDIKKSNESNKQDMESFDINTNRYNTYLQKLWEISALLDKDLNKTELNQAMNKLVEEMWNTDNELDWKIKYLIGRLNTAWIDEIPGIKNEIQSTIEEKIKKTDKIKKEYENEKNWTKKTAHEFVQHEKNISKFNSYEMEEYESGLKVEIKDLNGEIMQVANKLSKNDNDFWENTFPNWIDSEEYMKNKNDIDNALEMTYKSITETIQYIENFSDSDDLTMHLPWIDDEEWTITFKNKADKLFYCKMFLETLKKWLNDINDKWWIWIKILAWMGILAIVWWVIIWKIPYVKMAYMGFNCASWVLKKTPLIKKLAAKIPKLEVKNETGTTNSSTGVRVEKKWDFITRERALEMVEQFEKKYLEPIKDANDYDKLNLEIEKLKKFINNWGLDKAKEIQLWEMLWYLETNNELPTNLRGKVADKVKEKTRSTTDWHNNKWIRERAKEGAWKFVQEKIAWKKPIVVPRIDEIKSHKGVKDFVNELWKAEEKIIVRFGWEDIEVTKDLKNLLSDIEEGRNEFKIVEKAEWLKNLYDASVAEKDRLELELKKDPKSPSNKESLSSINREILRLRTEFIGLELDELDISKFDAVTEKKALWADLDLKLKKIKTKIKWATIIDFWKIDTKLKSKEIDKIIKRLIEALKEIK